ncbi:hypothetical protein Mal15_12970 [Stieleria maiorica]|uniref:Bacterial type II and III secretion system protein n=2 Tax=Stieleria maiorica TaxID=2795974 RepID=A0A5B9M7T6_9BACT|nr:hypothetical protein Mal15_12970 [Stieleria maiorica]
MIAVVVLACLTLGPRSAEAQGNVDQPAPDFVTKVYNIADLLDAPSMLQGDTQQAETTVGGGGMGFGGADGMGAEMGGGFFRIPDNILPQFAGGMGGMGGGGGVHVLPNRMTREALEQLTLDHLSNENTQWLDLDGVGGKLSIVASMMIVTHTEATHTKVAEFLELLRVGNHTSPTIQVDVRIVEVASDQSVSDLTKDLESLEALANDSSAARLSLRCDNHRVATVSSGLRRSYVVSLTPVVGSNGSIDVTTGNQTAYRPETYSPLLGLFGRIKPEVDAEGKSGRIHLGIQLASGPEEVVAATFGTGQSIDRVELETAQLATSIATAANTWTLAGSVAVTSPTSSITSGEALPHLAVLVRWQAVD